MKITTAICTWNRSRLLDQTLAAMTKVHIPKALEWELLVVNNNCTDETDDVISRHSASLPVRRIFEPKPGLSHARNAAVQAASGDFILWTDDDVIVDSGWVGAYAAAMERFPDVSIFGGPIAPWFEGTPPEWLKSFWPKVANAYAICDLGPHSFPLSERILPYGANYGVRLPAHKRFLYDPALGRKGNGMVGYEESTLIRAMFREGFLGIWVPEAKVSHFIPKERQSIQYLRRYFHGQGLFLTGREEPSNVPLLFGAPRWLVKRVVQSRLKYGINRLLRSPDIWIDDLIQFSTSQGLLHGSSHKRVMQ